MNAPTGTKGKTLLRMAAAVSVAVIMGVVDMAESGIVGSKHDLSPSGSSQLSDGKVGDGAGGAATSTGEVCVFCHTPHGANTAEPIPLWNKALTGTGFTMYSSLNTSTFDSTEGALGSVSLACLSCHDGSQAMDAVINAPGSNGYNAAGASIYASYAVGADGSMAAGTIANLGKDLQNDHPISIPYAAGLGTAGAYTAAPGSTLGTQFKDADFNAIYGDSFNSYVSYWVDTTGGTAGEREKSDLILYSRGVAGSEVPYVECASCHDPHSAGGGAPATFLRISNDNSAVCLACHNK